MQHVLTTGVASVMVRSVPPQLTPTGNEYTAAHCDADRAAVVHALLRIATYRMNHPEFGNPIVPLLRFASDLWEGNVTT